MLIKKLTIKEFINQLHCVALTLVFFSGACLYNADNAIAYIAIVVAITMYTGLYCIYNLKAVTKALNSSFFWWIVALFGMYTFYGTMLPVYGDYNTDYILFMALIIIDVIFLFSILDIERFTKILIKSSAFSCILICIYIGINEWANIAAGNVRIGDSGSGNVNTIGIYLGMLCIPILYKWICLGEKKYLLVFGIQVLFMLLTGSKKVLLLMITGFLVLLVLKNRWHLHRYFIPLFIALGFSLLIVNNSYFYNIIGFRVVDFLGTLGFNVGYYNESTSTKLRLLMYSLGWQAFKEHPLLGGGYFYFSQFSGLGTYTHNNYLEMLVNYGILGFTLYYSMFVYVIKRLIRLTKKSDISKLYFSLIIAILLVDTAAVTFSMAPLNYIVLLFIYLYARSKSYWRTT